MNQEPPILQGGEDVTIATISNSFGNIFLGFSWLSGTVRQNESRG